MDKPLVSIVTVNYNQAEVTCALLASLRGISYPCVQIIVVDNASPTDDPGSIPARFPEVLFIKAPENLGFAGGNNLGVRQARGKYVLFLNNDTEVSPGFLEPLVELFETNPAVGIASAKLLYFDTPGPLIQYAGSTNLNPWTGRNRSLGSFETDRGQYDRTYPTGLAHGAAMMVPLHVIRQVGLMSALYFLYFEELDWCEAIKRAGYACYYVGQSAVLHKESVSVGRSSALRTYYMHRNRLLFIRRNYCGLHRWSGLLFFLLAAAPKQALVHLLRREWQHLAAVGRGIAWHLRPRNVHQNEFLPAAAPVSAAASTHALVPSL